MIVMSPMAMFMPSPSPVSPMCSAPSAGINSLATVASDLGAFYATRGQGEVVDYKRKFNIMA